jgi:hypothetical protein
MRRLLSTSNLRFLAFLKLAVGVAAVTFLLTTGATPVKAQATRTWVSGVGDDANPCSRTAPCKTFPGAISKTAAGGAINCLDPGGFGAVTITKAITIDCRATEGGLLAASVNGINVSAGAADVIIIRGLDIDGAGSGLIGINYLTGAAVIVEDTTIRRFNAGSGRGIFAPAAVGGGTFKQLSVSNCDISFNGIGGGGAILGGGGIVIGEPLNAPGLGAIRATVENTRLVRNNVGLRANPNSSTTIHHTFALQNTSQGFLAASGGGGVFLNIDDSVASESINGSGITGNGPNVVIRMGRTVVTSNNVGLERVGAAVIESYGDNYIRGNFTTNGPAPTIVPKS